MPLVEKRYAEALVDLSVQQNAIQLYKHELQSVADVFDRQEDFRLFLLNPEITTGVKKDLIKTIFEGSIKTELMNFLLLLLDKHRIKYLPGIAEVFMTLADERSNILNLTIVTSELLESSQVDMIKEKYRIIYNAAAVKANMKIDRKVIGGVKIIIGDKVIDGTLKGRLENLKSFIVNKNN